jgi:hypothetical protein
MGQSKAHRWIHVLLGALRATLRAGGCSHPVRKGIGPTSQGGRGGSGRGRHAYPDIIDRAHSARGSVHTHAHLLPFGHDGTERRIERPQNLIALTRSDRGKKTCHTVKNLLLIEVALTILLRIHTDAGSTHD